MATTGPTDATQRKVGIPLAVGIVFLPFIFAWFTLRKGYSMVARVVSCGWMVLVVIAAAAGGTGGPAPVPEAKSLEQLETDKAEKLQQQLERDPAKALTLEATGQKGGFDTVLIISGSISNSADFPIKDVRIECELFGNSGTRVGRVTQTLFEIVPAGGSKQFADLNMGFMGGAGQVATFDCRPTRAVKG